MTTMTTDVRANARKTTNGFWWADLSSTDDAAAAEFYSEVFGWSWNEMPIGENMVHRNAHINGLLTAGLDPVMPGSGQPTAWTNFVFITDINATCESAKALGATIIAEPMDVFGEGHMAVLADPNGAFVGLWQPGRHTGADAVDQPNTYTWVELATDDIAGARKFYGELFGWTWERMDTGNLEYWIVMNDGVGIAGVMEKPAEMKSMPNLWTSYFGVADLDVTLEAVRSAGGTVAFEPMQMGPGMGAGVVDPQGGYFVAYKWDEWPEN